jgi:mutual gliding-motility protein MglA
VEDCVQLNFAAKEVTLKLVYYGPAMSGKTTNLKALHDRVDEKKRGRLMQLATRDDRTLFFDMLPISVRSEQGMSLRIKLFTVPGQVVHSATRKLVLQGADGVAFIADSQLRETENNAAAFLDLRENLKELGRPIKEVPVVIQFNKRDLPNVRTDHELHALASKGREPVFAAAAMAGDGVLESFLALLFLTCKRLDEEHQLGSKVGITLTSVLESAASQLGADGPPAALLEKRLGAPPAGWASVGWGKLS